MNILKGIRRVLDDEPTVWFAFLFGSRARRSARPGSDWDVAVYLDDSLDDRQRFDIRRGLSAQLSGPDGPRVDLVVLNDAPPLLAHRALKGRKLVNRNRHAYVRFFTRVMGEVEDEQHFYGFHERARRDRLAEGRFGRP
jgi:predicted nucleotidyltransferase